MAAVFEMVLLSNEVTAGATVDPNAFDCNGDACVLAAGDPKTLLPWLAPAGVANTPPPCVGEPNVVDAA